MQVLKEQKSLIEWCSRENLRIVSDIYPDCDVKTPPIKPTKEVLKAIKAKPYINNLRVSFSIFYNCEQYTLLFKKGYEWDGASIPPFCRLFIGAKGSPEFLIASMVHDKLCENHDFINYDRYLSSLIFKELLLAQGVGESKANTMFYAVDWFQRFFGGWGRKK